jgi:hypothetical protein
MRLTVFGAVLALATLASTRAGAQDAPAPDLSPAPLGVEPPAATDSAGAPIPSTQPPPFVPAPVAPRTGPKTSDLLDDTAENSESDAEADAEDARPTENARPGARAEVQPELVPPVAPPVEPALERVPPPLPARPRAALYGLGAALMLGGGFQQFTNGNLRDMTGGGGFWNLRAVVGTRQFIGLEAAYVGGAHNMNALGFGNRAALVSNGAEGTMRINVPLTQDRSLFEPFGFVGVGWSRYNVVNTPTQSSDVASLDNVLTVPYGGGIAMAYGSFIVDARFTYRSTYYSDLMRTTGASLDSWGVGAQAGMSF